MKNQQNMTYMYTFPKNVKIYSVKTGKIESKL